MTQKVLLFSSLLFLFSSLLFSSLLFSSLLFSSLLFSSLLFSSLLFSSLLFSSLLFSSLLFSSLLFSSLLFSSLLFSSLLFSSLLFSFLLFSSLLFSSLLFSSVLFSSHVLLSSLPLLEIQVQVSNLFQGGRQRSIDIPAGNKTIPGQFADTQGTVTGVRTRFRNKLALPGCGTVARRWLARGRALGSRSPAEHLLLKCADRLPAPCSVAPRTLGLETLSGLASKPRVVVVPLFKTFLSSNFATMVGTEDTALDTSLETGRATPGGTPPPMPKLGTRAPSTVPATSAAPPCVPCGRALSVGGFHRGAPNESDPYPMWMCRRRTSACRSRSLEH